jgi:hypothetical protein
LDYSLEGRCPFRTWVPACAGKAWIMAARFPVEFG